MPCWSTRTDSRRPVVLLQDYHLYLAATNIRAERPDALLLHFNHIPWPAVDSWLVLPQGLRRAICEGLLANDIVGLQTDRYATNFLHIRSTPSCATPTSIPTAAMSAGVAARSGCAPTQSRSSPTRWRRSPAARVERRKAELRARLERAGNPKLIVRVDRLEPSKNALRGFVAFENLLKRRPELREVGSLPGHPVGQPRERGRLRQVRGRGARSGGPRERHGRPRRRPPSGCSTGPTTTWPLPRSRSPTSSWSTRSSTA